MATAAPLFANSSTAASPMPDEPPVTRTVLPERWALIICSPSHNRNSGAVLPSPHPEVRPPGLTPGLLQMSKEAEEVLLLPFRLSHFAGGGSFVRVGVEDVEGEASDDGKVFGGVILAGTAARGPRARPSPRAPRDPGRPSAVRDDPHLHQGRLHPAPALEPRRHRQVLGAQELRIEQLRLVARAVVAEHRHDRVPRTVILREPDRT